MNIGYFEERHKEAFVTALKAAGLTPPARAFRPTRSWERFLLYAMKRAGSNHPHNVRWKPLHEAYIAMQVADALEAS